MVAERLLLSQLLLTPPKPLEIPEEAYYIHIRSRDRYFAAVPVGCPISWQHAPAPERTGMLITGCGRSGTHSITTELNGAGMAAIHETPLPEHGGSVFVSWAAAGFVRSAQYWRMKRTLRLEFGEQRCRA